MQLSSLLSALLLLVCVTFCGARPGPQATAVTLNPGCRETALFQCIGPVIAFVMSADGQRITKLRKSGSIGEPDFSKMCRLGQTTTGCMDAWIDKCLPGQTDLHILSQGTVDIFSFCSEAGSFEKFNKLTACAEKMNDTHKACGEKLRASLPSATLNHSTPKALLNRQDLQRDVCCNIKKYNSCFNKPDLETICGNEAKSLTNEFVTRIMNSYKCTDAVFTTCDGSDTSVAA